MTPGDQAAAPVEAGVQPLRGAGVIVAVAHVVGPVPLQANRLARLLREPGRLSDKVGLGLAAEPTTQQRLVDSHRMRRKADGSRDHAPRALGSLHRGPDLATTPLNPGHAGRGLHRRMGQVWDRVGRGEGLGGLSQRPVCVPDDALGLPRALYRITERRPVCFAARAGIGAGPPGDPERVTTPHGCPGVRRDHRDPAQGLEHRRSTKLPHLKDIHNPGHGARRGGVEGVH